MATLLWEAWDKQLRVGVSLQRELRRLMLPGLEDMLVNLTDAADRALCSALVQPIVQGLKLRSKKSTKARALAVAAHSVRKTPEKSSGGRLHPNRIARTAPDRSSGRP